MSCKTLANYTALPRKIVGIDHKAVVKPLRLKIQGNFNHLEICVILGQ